VNRQKITAFIFDLLTQLLLISHNNKSGWETIVGHDNNRQIYADNFKHKHMIEQVNTNCAS